VAPRREVLLHLLVGGERLLMLRQGQRRMLRAAQPPRHGGRMLLRRRGVERTRLPAEAGRGGGLGHIGLPGRRPLPLVQVEDDQIRIEGSRLRPACVGRFARVPLQHGGPLGCGPSRCGGGALGCCGRGLGERGGHAL
jgi:hypothetical protein